MVRMWKMEGTYSDDVLDRSEMRICFLIFLLYKFVQRKQFSLINLPEENAPRKIKTLISRLWEISQNRSLLFSWLYLFFIYWTGGTHD